MADMGLDQPQPRAPAEPDDVARMEHERGRTGLADGEEQELQGHLAEVDPVWNLDPAAGRTGEGRIEGGERALVVVVTGGLAQDPCRALGVGLELPGEAAEADPFG
jgi:hypothetical protein